MESVAYGRIVHHARLSRYALTVYKCEVVHEVHRKYCEGVQKKSLGLLSGAFPLQKRGTVLLYLIFLTAVNDRSHESTLK